MDNGFTKLPVYDSPKMRDEGDGLGRALHQGESEILGYLWRQDDVWWFIKDGQLQDASPTFTTYDTAAEYWRQRLGTLRHY